MATKRKHPKRPKPIAPVPSPVQHSASPKSVLVQVQVPHDLYDRFSQHAARIANNIKLEGLNLVYRHHGAVPAAVRYLMREACEAIEGLPPAPLPTLPTPMKVVTPTVPHPPQPPPPKRAEVITHPTGCNVCSTTRIINELRNGGQSMCPACGRQLAQ